MPIAIIDYGAGNLRSVQKALEKLGFDAVITDNAEIISKASGTILPGVGAFDSAIEELEAKKLIPVIKAAISSGKPFLGLCLGMQLLFESSEEGSKAGLGILKGKVRKFESWKVGKMNGAESSASGKQPDTNLNFPAIKPSNPQTALKIPHMGWNNISIKKSSPLLKDVKDGTKVYFVHSYYCDPADSSDILTSTGYGADFVSSVEKGNIFGLQFHPEKSAESGLKILKNFGGMCK